MIFVNISEASSCEFVCVGTVSLYKVSRLSHLQPEPVFRGGIQLFPVVTTTDPSLATVGVTALLLGHLPSIYWGLLLHGVAVTTFIQVPFALFPVLLERVFS